jgi:hypothetical protein
MEGFQTMEAIRALTAVDVPTRRPSLGQREPPIPELQQHDPTSKP